MQYVLCFLCNMLYMQNVIIAYSLYLRTYYGASNIIILHCLPVWRTAKYSCMHAHWSLPPIEAAPHLCEHASRPGPSRSSLASRRASVSRLHPSDRGGTICSRVNLAGRFLFDTARRGTAPEITRPATLQLSFRVAHGAAAASSKSHSVCVHLLGHSRSTQLAQKFHNIGRH